VNERDDLHTSRRVPKDDHERKPPQEPATRAKVVWGVLLRILADPIDCTIKVI
jgi:hypothetical protein